jgi:hypothetical protein
VEGMFGTHVAIEVGNAVRDELARVSSESGER